jgi:predicted O-linked N-acetylglucosamine transferase (SPINDLY family)
MSGHSQSDPSQLWRLATQAHQAGRLAEAEAHYRAVLTLAPRHVDAWQLLALVLATTDRLDEAAASLQTAISLGGEHPVFLNNLGEIRRRQGQLQPAEALFRRAVRAAPAMAEAHYNLANVLKELGEDDEAVRSYRQALELQPTHAKARFNLANTLREQGRVPVAATEYERLAREQPQWFEARINYGVALTELARTDEALLQFQQALAIKPDEPLALDNLGDVHAKRGQIEQARACYVRASAGQCRPLRQLRIDALVEPISRDNPSINAYRQRLLRRVQELAEENFELNLAELGSCGAEPPTLLAYQGRDDRPIREAYGRLFAPRIPPLDPLPADGPPRVGMVVTKGHEGVFARCLGSLIERIDPQRLQVTICCPLAAKNVLSLVFGMTRQRYLVLPPSLVEAAQAIRAARFDVLHYWEVGTDSMNYFLPFFKPARLQSTTWGWPVTTGNPRVDYFVSARGLEPEDGPDHYLERLVVLESVPTYYVRPPTRQPLRPREAFGLPGGKRLYFCAQNLRKVHPDFDAILAGIAAADPDGVLVFLHDEQATITGQLLDRWKRNRPDVIERVLLLPRLEREDYLNVLALCDVGLDTLYYGGGANTIYDAVATGTPTVTLPWRFHRGRYAAATYRQLDLPELIAESVEDYVARAVRIAQQPDRREHLHRQLVARSEKVLENANAVAAYTEFFLEAAGR